MIDIAKEMPSVQNIKRRSEVKTKSIVVRQTFLIECWYDDNGDNTLFSTLMTLGRATRISLSKKSKNRLTKSVDQNPFDNSPPPRPRFSRDATD